MVGSFFTLELIADALKGSVGSGLLNASTSEIKASDDKLKPILGLKLLDLAPVLVDALENETYDSSFEHRVAFGGHGKALVFELPCSDLGRFDKNPMPLWLMALAKRPTAGTPLVLLASACIDFSEDIARAITGDGKLGAHCSTLSSPFKKCCFIMTPVKDSGCMLSLDCYVRLYAGSQRPLSGGELLLEPSAVLPGLSAVKVPERRCAQTQTDCSETVGAPSPSTDLPALRDTAPKQEGECLPGRTQMAADCVTKRVKQAGATTTASVFFADEIRFRSQGCADSEAPVAIADGIDAHSFAPAQPPHEAVSALPFVSELVRDLLQSRCAD